MSIQRFETGPRMSQVVVNGNTVYLAGVVANKAKGKSTTEQTQEILSIIDGHLAKAGTDKSKLLSTNIYITDMKNFAEMNAVWDKWVSPGNTPARATVQAGLATRPDSIATVDTIGVPVLAIAGGEDVSVSPVEMEAFRAAPGGCEFHVLADAGHFAAYEQPQTVAALLGSWLNIPG